MEVIVLHKKVIPWAYVILRNNVTPINLIGKKKNKVSLSIHGYSPESNSQKTLPPARLGPIVPFCWWDNREIGWQVCTVSIASPWETSHDLTVSYNIWKVPFLLKRQLTACFLTQIPWLCFHHLFFHKPVKEVCYSVNCLMIDCIPFLRKASVPFVVFMLIHFMIMLHTWVVRAPFPKDCLCF